MNTLNVNITRKCTESDLNVKFKNDNYTINCLLNFINDLDCRCCYFFCINDNKLIFCENSVSFN